jgi:hypothetical protein
MPVHIGGKQAYLQRITGDIVSSYQWVNEEPAMILWPAIRRTIGGGAYVICLSSAFKYTDQKYLIQQAVIAARQIGMDETSFTIRRIADVILDGLGDLLAMPPTPRDWKDKEIAENIGELLIKVDGETIAHREVSVPGTVQ